MTDKFISILKARDFSVPKVLLCNYSKLNLTEKELIILIFLINNPGKTIFNPKGISTSLNMNMTDVLEIINNLITKGCLEIKLEKNSNGITEEYINTDLIYHKLALFLIGNEDKKEEAKSTNIFDIFEQEFGRTLSPMEYEIINAWLESDYKEELIISALKEAIYNGVSSLRYIDKILYEWNRKGIKSVDDIRLNSLRRKREKEEKKEVFEYDWLEDGE